MNTDGLPLNPDDMRLLAEIAFMAAESGQLPAARTIFEALHTLRSESTLPYIGLALAEIFAERPEDAARILREEGLAAHPDDQELKAFLGLALYGAGHAIQARAVLGEVVSRGPATLPHVRMASKLLSADPEIAGPVGLMPRWGLRLAS